MTLVGGAPEIVGGAGAGCTVIVKAGSDTVVVPSLTETMMFAYEPTALAAGVPDSRPDVGSKVAHAGLFAIENVNGAPDGLEAVGWKRYGWVALTVVGGVPEMTGAAGGRVATVTVADPDCVGSCTETAVICTVGWAGGVAGAVYRPPVEMVPTVLSPPVTPFTAQVTAVLLAFVTVAVKS